MILAPLPGPAGRPADADVRRGRAAYCLDIGYAAQTQPYDRADRRRSTGRSSSALDANVRRQALLEADSSVSVFILLAEARGPRRRGKRLGRVPSPREAKYVGRPGLAGNDRAPGPLGGHKVLGQADHGQSAGQPEPAVVGDQTNGAPAHFQQAEDPPGYPLQLGFDGMGKANGVGAVVVAQLVDPAGLHPASGAGLQRHLGDVRSEELVVSLRYCLAQTGRVGRTRVGGDLGPKVRAKRSARDLVGDGGDGGLGGIGHCGQRGPPVRDPDGAAPVFQALGQPLAQLVAKSVDEDDALVLAGFHEVPAVGAGERRAFRGRLEGPRRRVHPGFQQVADDLDDHSLVLGRSRRTRHGFSRGSVGLPTDLRVGVRDFLGRRPSDGRPGGLGQPSQGLQDLGDRRLAETRP